LARAVDNIDLVFSPTVDSFPLVSNKLVCVGHGVKSESFPYSDHEDRKGVVTVGRVVPIKRIETYIQNFSTLKPEVKKLYSPLFIIGDTSIDADYVNFINAQALQAGLDVQFLGQIRRESIPTLLNRANFYFLGTPKSIDKASIEAAMCGCVILSENLEAVSILGPRVVPGKGLAVFKTLVQQFETYAFLPDKTLKRIQNEVSRKAKSQNDLDEVVNRIVDQIK
jgi:glycosyltransferase involved in cell wall biosynthesis